MKTFKTATFKDLEYFETFFEKEVYCIKECIGTWYDDDFKPVEVILEKGKFYPITGINNKSDDDFLIWCGHLLFTYDNFFKRFELKTLQDIRKDKINSILK